jgi:hypothetical protein
VTDEAYYATPQREQKREAKEMPPAPSTLKQSILNTLKHGSQLTLDTLGSAVTSSLFKAAPAADPQVQKYLL